GAGRGCGAERLATPASPVSSTRISNRSIAPLIARAQRVPAPDSAGLRCRLIEDDRLRLQVGIHPFRAAFPSDARLLEAAEGDAEVRLEGIVPDRPRAEPSGHRVGTLRILREHRGVETVDRVVGD